MKLVQTAILGKRNIFHEGLASTLKHSQYRICKNFISFNEKSDDSLRSVASPSLYILIDCEECKEKTKADIATTRSISSDVCIVMVSDSLADLSWAFDAGCDGCLPSSISPKALIMALDLLMCREVVITNLQQPPREPKKDDVVDVDPRSRETLVRPTVRVEALSVREEEVLRAVALGQSNKLIARRLGIGEATVKGHVRAVLRKIGAVNRTQAAIWVHVNGSVESTAAQDHGAANGMCT